MNKPNKKFGVAENHRLNVYRLYKLKGIDLVYIDGGFGYRYRKDGLEMEEENAHCVLVRYRNKKESAVFIGNYQECVDFVKKLNESLEEKTSPTEGEITINVDFEFPDTDESVIDWDELEFDYVAWDEDGECVNHKSFPERDERHKHWIRDTHQCLPQYDNLWQGDWRDSLMIRPKCSSANVPCPSCDSKVIMIGYDGGGDGYSVTCANGHVVKMVPARDDEPIEKRPLTPTIDTLLDMIIDRDGKTYMEWKDWKNIVNTAKKIKENSDEQ